MQRQNTLVALAGLLLLVSLFSSTPAAAVPSNGWIVWASDRQDSRHEIYLMKADGTQVSRLTFTGARMPAWSPDGEWISYETVPIGFTRVMRWDGSEDHQICPGKPGFWRWDGSGLVCRVGDDDLYLADPAPGAGSPTYLTTKGDFSQMTGKAWSPSGMTTNNRFLVTWTDRYRNGYTGTNGTFDAYHAAVILDMQSKSDVYFFGRGCEPTTPPSGDWVYHVCGGTFCDWPPDVYRMRVADRASRSSYQIEIAHEDDDWGHEYFPRVSTDGAWLTYGATDSPAGAAACHDHDTCDYEIFVHQLGQGSSDRVRVTSHGDNDQWPHMYVGALWTPPDPASLSLSPTTLNLSATEGGSAPAAQSVAVSNSGGGTLNSVSASESAAWLSVSRSGSGNSQSLSNGVDITGLSPGDYSETVQVSCANADNSPRSYTVNVTISAAAPRLELSTGSLGFSAVEGGADPSSRNVTVTNDGGGTLDNVTVSEGADWLTVTRSGSGNSQTLANSIDISGLSQGVYSEAVEVSCANAQASPQTYTVELTVSQQLSVVSVEVSAAPAQILPGATSNVTAVPRDQNGNPIDAVITWTVSGGGAVAPATSGSAVSSHTTTFTSDGSAGTYTVTAEADGVSGDAEVQVSAVPLPLFINCGSNDHDVTGWWRDDLFVSGGEDWINPNEVETSGVAGAAPAEVYKSVRHLGPHSFDLPVPDGDYTLVLHFADAYTERHMDYFVEGVQILSDFDISSQAGGTNIALVKVFGVTVADGDGMQIEAQSEGDVFEAGIEVIPGAPTDAGVVQDAAAPDTATAPDAGLATDTSSSADAPATDIVGAPDGGAGSDAASAADSAAGADAPSVNDGASGIDAASGVDTGSAADSARPDSGAAAEDGGVPSWDLEEGEPLEIGHGCTCRARPSLTDSTLISLGFLTILLVVRRSRHRR